MRRVWWSWQSVSRRPWQRSGWIIPIRAFQSFRTVKRILKPRRRVRRTASPIFRASGAAAAAVAAAVEGVAIADSKERAEEREAVLIHLRNWLIEGARDRGVTAQRISREVLIYMKTQRALVAYLANERVDRLYPMREEAFMLPGEAPHRADAGQQRSRREP